MDNAAIAQSDLALGIELGSTRIKAVLIRMNGQVVSSGSHEWCSSFRDNHWTYSLTDVWAGVQKAYLDLKRNFADSYAQKLITFGCLGISGMMHGYLPFNADGEQIAEFRTWQDTTTTVAADELCDVLGQNIPIRWSVAHLYQALLNGEDHLRHLDYLTTLSGYVHWKLTGQKVLGIGDVSGMFPLEAKTPEYNKDCLAKFDELVKKYEVPWRLIDVLPEIRLAGQQAGKLSEEGAALLDPEGDLQAGIPMAPPEGDAGTGMIATNAILPNTANISAGTSIFAMLVMEEGLGNSHREIDLVATPDGNPVAMVHCNNGAAEMSNWVRMLGAAARLFGLEVSDGEVFAKLYQAALEADPDCGGLLSVNFLVGEPTAGLAEGRPLVTRSPESALTIQNFMRSQIYTMFATLRMGFDILRSEGISVDSVVAHGGIFKTEGVAQQFLADALECPVSVGEGASEGGPWGMALLAAFLKVEGQSLSSWLNKEIFAAAENRRCLPQPEGVVGFNSYLQRFVQALPTVAKAVETLER